MLGGRFADLRPSTFNLRRIASRHAYTLIELLLVLAIIVIAAAAVAPSMRRMARNAALKAAAGDVRAELTRAHVQAMKSGRIQAFQYELGGRKYKVEPWIGDDDALESDGSDPNASLSALVADNPAKGERSLPEEISFALGDSAIESRGERIEQELSASGVGVTWSRPILFYPDGSSANAFVVVANDYDVGIRLDLRGMTGAVMVGQLTKLSDLETGAALPQ